MGSSVVRALCRNEQVQLEKIRCFTRNPNSDAARQLAALDERIEYCLSSYIEIRSNLPEKFHYAFNMNLGGVENINTGNILGFQD